MSIQDNAYNGTLLTRDQLPSDTSSINAIGGAIQLTPLCAACFGGRLQTVKFLLRHGADPNTPSSGGRTPLFFITDLECLAPSALRCAIIRALTEGDPKANLNDPCDEDGNTPLINAIAQLKDETVIGQLVDSGASTDGVHPSTKTPLKDIAKEHDMLDSLRSKADKEAMWGKLVDLVVSFVLLVISYANNNTATKVMKGVVGKYYEITVKEADVSKDRQKEVEPKSVEQFQSFLNDEIKQDRKFERFFPPNDSFLTNLAAKANALREDTTTSLGNPDNIKHLTRLSLYRPIIYCDDSGSMRHENRYEHQIELVTRIARIATKIVPDDMVDVQLRFINNMLDTPVKAEKIQEAMRKVHPNGQTNIGTNLRKKILEPFVYKLIAQPITPGSLFPFRRPLLVCIITDGTPDPEASNVLRDEIMECKKKLEAKGYDPTAVMFVISQIGTSKQAALFIDGLRKEEDIQDVIYCTVGQLDTQFKELKDKEWALESWLLRVLTKPIMERHLE